MRSTVAPQLKQIAADGKVFLMRYFCLAWVRDRITLPSIMFQFRCCLIIGLISIAGSFGILDADTRLEPHPDANRLTYLDDDNPFYPGLKLAKLVTPQWVGEPGVEAVVILAIDDMRQPEKYETVLRPLLDRLKRIDGRAPVSIMCTSIDPGHPQLVQWLKEGVSLEVHTLTHPCPFLAKSNFVAAAATYHDCVDLLHQVSGNAPVAFRMPCCDSINSPSPRFYSEIFNRVSPGGRYLTVDSSVMNILSSGDAMLPRDLVLDPDGKEKFRKYLPFPSFTTTIENYPYPYVIGKLCWELPPMVPSDWEAQHINGTNSPVTVADWKCALDATVKKQGTFTFIFHPHGWIRPDQMVSFIDYAVQTYGSKVKFLNFREAEERLNRNFLGGTTLRDSTGRDNGVRVLDLNNDGYMDVVIGNGQTKKTRVWQPDKSAWLETSFPTSLVSAEGNGGETGARFGVIDPDGSASLLMNGVVKGAWHFDQTQWVENTALLNGLEIEGETVRTSDRGRDRGVRLRDVDNDGRCEVLVGNESQNAAFAWSAEELTWKKLPYGLPPGVAIVDALGQENGLRFIDINGDGYDDAILSNASSYSLHLFVPKLYLGFQAGWSRVVLHGKRGDAGEIPMFVRSGPQRNNGAWFHSGALWVQNEDTAGLPDYVDHRSFGELVGGLQPHPKTPKESLASMSVLPGFTIELVASEPLLEDPIAFEWGADGKLWVVEMGDYPLGVDGHGKSGGTIRFLEDTDGDGIYDKSTAFLEGVNFPTGVMPWGNGVLVSAAPEIFYAEDRDGDGKADVRITLFRGFREGNQQHRLNGFEYGLDNWVYGANGDSGGQIEFAGLPPLGRAQSIVQPNSKVDLRGHDFRFRPNEGVFETVSGQTQFGRHRDDWGNWIGNNNSTWLWHVYLPEHYLTRNPFLPVKSVKEYLANYTESSRVFPISRSLQRFNDVVMLNHVTSANSPTPYRDDLFGPGFASSVFISEPVHNTVHREVLEPEGVTFTSHRAPEEQDREFLASGDNWFRPTMLKTGPDGALYVADMYRLVIEHPEWIPADAQRQFDLRAGHDKGRIYRIYPADAHLRKIPRLAGASLSDLLKAFNSPNGWTRDTVQRLLVQAQEVSAAGGLEQLSLNSADPKVRLQALCTLDGLGKLTAGTLMAALNDTHPAVREHAVRLAESLLNERASDHQASVRDSEANMTSLKERLLELVNDPAIRVRYQLAFTLGEWHDPRAGRALVGLAARDSSDSRMQVAILSSAVPHIKTMVQSLVGESRDHEPVSLLQDLLSLSVAVDRDDVIVKAIESLAQRGGLRFESWQWTALGGLIDGMERKQGSLQAYQESATPKVKKALTQLNELFDHARQIALDGNESEMERITAIHLLGRGPEGEKKDIPLLAEFLKPQNSSRLQESAVENLGRLRDPEVASIFLSGWRSYEPDMRTHILNVLASRPQWVEQLLDSIEKKEIPVAQISPPLRQKMLASSQESIRNRAQRLFAVTSNRQQLLREYHLALERDGDYEKGGGLFKQNCATCHRLHDEGTNVGPDLGALGDKSAQTLLIAILDPNQAVETRYVNYTAVTKSDREISGIIAADTPGSVTLRGPGGVEETILRSELREFTSSGLSLMPEGFEKIMNPQELADLIAFIKRK